MPRTPRVWRREYWRSRASRRTACAVDDVDVVYRPARVDRFPSFELYCVSCELCSVLDEAHEQSPIVI